VASAMGLPKSHPVSYTVSLELPRVQWRTSTAASYICRCKVLKVYACDAGLATVLFAYYAARRDLGAATQLYETFKHCASKER